MELDPDDPLLLSSDSDRGPEDELGPATEVDPEAESSAPAGPSRGGAPYDGSRQSLDPANVAAERLAGWIAVAFLAAGLPVGWILLWLVSDLPPWGLSIAALGGSLVLAGFAWLAHFWPPIAHRRVSYRVDAEGIEIRRGVVWRSVTSVPRARIQHTDVTQGPVERKFGLATLVIHTAGSENARVNLQGLARPTALAVRDFLIAEGGGGDAV